ncbi:MAG: hypothetical protein ACFHX7_23025 [Pseudomonadota bacterium]
MASPWSDAGLIRHTQASISFIMATRPAFELLPSAFVLTRVEYYAREILPLITRQNTIEFGLEALSIWANQGRHYLSIVRGVKLACAMIRSLRRFADQPELDTPQGELAALITELRELLARPYIRSVPDQEASAFAWRMLRLDQVFRFHESSTIARLLQLASEIDALVAMADVTRTNTFTLPDVIEGPLGVHGEGMVHPFVNSPVANPVTLDQSHRVLFLTGPNMAGKTTYLRAFATALYLAHLGMGVPARSFRFVPAERLFSAITLRDNLRSGVSYFRAEALRVKAVAQAIADGYRVVAIMDEPFKGTNVKDALDASLAILHRFATRKDCLFMFSSHLIELTEQAGTSEQISCRHFEADESGGRLRFDYRLRTGVSSQRLGMRVLQEEGVFELLDQARD